MVRNGGVASGAVRGDADLRVVTEADVGGDTDAEISVVLVDEQALVRQGLRQIIELDTDLHVVAEAGSVDDGVSAVLETHPDLVVLELRLGSEDGIEVVRRLRGEGDQTPVLVLSTHEQPADLRAALAAGAAGYLLKSTTSEVLMQGLRDAVAGKTVIDHAFVTKLINEQRPTATPTATPRERAVLELVADGLTNREIGEQLGISARTAQKHLENLFTKFGVHDRAQLVSHAFRSGLLDADRPS